MTIEQIAEVCHEVNRAYCESLGDKSQPAWKDAPDWQKKSAWNGVLLHLKNPNLTPENSHNNWLDEKVEDGWKYGKVKDPEKKTHHCIVPYNELPADQKSKDYIFSQIIMSLGKFWIHQQDSPYYKAFENQDKAPS